MDKELIKQGQKRLSKQRNNRLWWEFVALVALIVLAGTAHILTDSATATSSDHASIVALDDYITGVDAEKYTYNRDNDTISVEGMKLVFEFKDGHELDVNKTYVYDCPDGVKVADELLNPEEGSINPYKMEIETGGLKGEYRLVKTDGGKYQIQIYFDGTPGDTVKGYVRFNSELVTRTVLEEDRIVVKITDGVELTSKIDKITSPGGDSTINYDLITEKSGALSGDDGRLHYKVKIYSSKGTPDPIHIEDTLDDPDGMLEKDSFVLERVRKMESQYWSVNQYGISATDKEDTATELKVQAQAVDGKFSLDLPALKKPVDAKSGKLGECYVIEYSYKITTWKTGNKTVRNKVKTSAEDKKTGEIVEVEKEFDYSISRDYTNQKTGELNQDEELVKWTLFVNTSHNDITDCELTDEMFDRINPENLTVMNADDGKVADARGYRVETNRDGTVKKIVFCMIDGNANKTKYKIVYTTGIENETSAVIRNRAEFTDRGGEEHEFEGEVSQSLIEKSCDGSYEDYPDEQYVVQGWKLAVKIPKKSGLKKGTVIFDYTCNSQNYGQEHYLTSDQMYELYLTVRDQWELLVSTQKPSWERPISYYQNESNYTKYHSSGTDDKYYAFCLKAKSDIKRPANSSEFVLKYRTTAEINGISQLGADTFRNTAYFDRESRAQFQYRKGGIIKTDGTGNSDASKVSNEDGRLTWVVKAGAENDGQYQTLKISDHMPDGIEVASYDISYGGECVNVTSESMNDKKEHEISDAVYVCTKDGNTLNVLLKKRNGSFFRKTEEIVITYHCKVVDAGQLQTGEKRKFTNSAVLWEGAKKIPSNQQTQEWTKTKKTDPEETLLEKNGIWDYNAQKISYSILINKSGKQIGDEGKQLELTDTLEVTRFAWTTNYALDTKAVLDLSSVRLYKAVDDGSGNFVQGDEVSRDEWNFHYDFTEYDSSDKKWHHRNQYVISAKVPNGTPLILKYDYRVAGDFEGWIKYQKGLGQKDPHPSLDFVNKAVLNGEKTITTGKEIQESWQKSKTSGGLLTDYHYEINKVEKGNYSILLQGAKFGIYKYVKDGEDQLVSTRTTDKNGRFDISFKEKDGSTLFTENTLYYVVETEAPEGYLIGENPTKYYFYFGTDNYKPDEPEDAKKEKKNLPVNLLAATSQSVVENIPDVTKVTVNKKWKNSDGKEVARKTGSISLVLYRVKGNKSERVEYNGTPCIQVTPDENGDWTYTFTHLSKHYIDEEGKKQEYRYFVKEIGVDDVNSLGQYTVSYSPDGDVPAEGTITITNKENTYELPATGGIGTKCYTYGGLLLIFIAGAAIVYRCKKQGVKKGGKE